MRRPKLLQPSPTSDTRSPDLPSVRYSIAFPLPALYSTRSKRERTPCRNPAASCSARWRRCCSASPPRRRSRNRRSDAQRVFLMVSGTLRPRDRRDRQGPPRARQSLRRRVRPDAAAHAAQRGDRRGGTGARGARRPDRHHRRRLDHRWRQGGAALPRQRHPHTRGAGCAASGEWRAAAVQRADGAAGHGADHAVRRRVLRHRRRHRRARQGEGAVPPSAHHSARGDPRSGDHRAHAGVAVPVHRHPRGGSLRRGHLLERGASVSPMRRRCAGWRCWRAGCRG